MPPGVICQGKFDLLSSIPCDDSLSFLTFPIFDRPKSYRIFPQNVVGFVQMIVAWAIPDVPRKLSDRIKREEYLTREIIIDHELQRTASAREREREQSPHLTKQYSDVFRLRKVNGENFANSEL